MCYWPHTLSTDVHGHTQAEQPQSFCDTLYMQIAGIAPSLPASTRQRRAAARAQATYARNLDVPGPLCRPSAAHGKRACHRDALFRGYRFGRLAARALHWSGAVGAVAHRGLCAGARATRAPSPSPTQGPSRADLSAASQDAEIAFSDYFFLPEKANTSPARPARQAISRGRTISLPC